MNPRGYVRTFAVMVIGALTSGLLVACSGDSTVGNGTSGTVASPSANLSQPAGSMKPLASVPPSIDVSKPVVFRMNDVSVSLKPGEVAVLGDLPKKFEGATMIVSSDSDDVTGMGGLGTVAFQANEMAKSGVHKIQVRAMGNPEPLISLEVTVN